MVTDLPAMKETWQEPSPAMGWIPGSGRSLGEQNDQHTPVFLPGETHEQRTWGHKSWK